MATTMNQYAIKLVKQEDDQQLYDQYGLYFAKLFINDNEQKKRLLFKLVGGERLAFIGVVSKRFWLLPNPLAKSIIEDAIRDFSAYNFSIHKQVYHDANEVMMSIAYVADKTVNIAGETYRLGFHFTNSEGGTSSLRLGAYLMRQVCKNGLAIHKDIVKHRVIHTSSSRLEHADMVDKIKKLVASVLQDEEQVVAFLEHTTKIRLDEELFTAIKNAIPLKYLKSSQIADKDAAGKIIYDDSMTLYDVICKVTEYATHQAKKEYQIIDMTSRLSKIAYNAVMKRSLM